MSKKPVLFFVEPHSVMRERVFVHLESGSSVVQEHLYDCNVTNIMNRYRRTGQLPPAKMNGAYGDVSDLSGMDYGDLQRHLSQSRQAVDEAVKNEQEIRQKVADASKTAHKAPSSAAAPTPNLTPPEA